MDVISGYAQQVTYEIEEKEQAWSETIESKP